MSVVRERFEVRSRDETVPGYLWTRERRTGGRAPLVLLGHGATGSKDGPFIDAFANRLVSELGFAVAAIDFPNHGERRPEAERGVPARQVRASMGLAAWRQRNSGATEQAIADLGATIDVAGRRDDVDPERVGYLGLSMGTRFGIPFVAGEPRVKAAVFGLFGWSTEALAGRSDAFASEAGAVRAPTLFLLQWDDELFSRQEGFALFDLLGSDEKTLHANPGGHVGIPRAEVDEQARFLGRHLTTSLDT